MTRTTFAAGAALCVLAAALAGCERGQPPQASASSAPASSAAAAQPTLTAGQVQSASASSLTITTPNGGSATFQLSPGTVIMVAHQGSVADIKAGSFIGTTNVPSADGTGQSTEVHIFPPGVKMGEGDRPMPSTNGSAATTRMTNGTVSAAGPAADGASTTRMTNGAAQQVRAGSAGVEMDVDYAGGKRHILVPPDTSVMVMSSGSTALLKPGTNVLVGSVPGANGARTATFVNVQ